MWYIYTVQYYSVVTNNDRHLDICEIVLSLYQLIKAEPFPNLKNIRRLLRSILKQTDFFLVVSLLSSLNCLSYVLYCYTESNLIVHRMLRFTIYFLFFPRCNSPLSSEFLIVLSKIRRKSKRKGMYHLDKIKYHTLLEAAKYMEVTS